MLRHRLHGLPVSSIRRGALAETPLFLALTLVLLWAGSQLVPEANGVRQIGPASTPSTETSAPPRMRLTDLPVAAQAAISTTLGRDDRAYHAVPASAGWLMRNSSQDITATFGPDRIVVGTGTEADTVQWGIRLRAYGRGDSVRPAPAVMPQRAANRVAYEREEMTEWYVNGPVGLEQGFTLTRRFAGPSDAQVRLELAVDGDLRPELDADAMGVTMVEANGVPRLRYRGLMAQDATGRSLAAALRLEGSTIVLTVDDRDARYPVVVDPFIEQAKLTASDGADGDEFGVSVALSGDTALVGAYGDDVGANRFQGSAYVFTRAGGIWTEQAQLTASDGEWGDLFGVSVALSGDTALVGAYGDDVGANVNEGSAYVFIRAGGVWTEQAHLIASDPGDLGESDEFGISVALSGDTALVGAHYDQFGEGGLAGFIQGSAYVFTRTDGVWTQQQKLTASDVSGEAVNGQFGQAVSAQFGASVALSGDTALVGAPRHGVTVNPDWGSAYMFTRAGTVWTEQARLTASDGAEDDQFGISVALSGETALVGADQDVVGGNYFQGSAYVFTGAGGVWTQQAKLTASDGAAVDRFGHSVALSGDTALVGAFNDDLGWANGSAYVFTRAGAVWTEQQKLTASDGEYGDEFGRSVALSADTALVGAHGDDVGANADQGSAYVFGGLGPAPPATLTLSPAAASTPVNSEHCVTATVQDSAGNPVPDVTVHFRVVGSVNTSDATTTDTNGVAMFCYMGPTSPGADAIDAFADTDNDGTQDPDEPTGAAGKTWVAGPPATLVLTPAAATNAVATEHCVTATVNDLFGNPAPGVTVRFAVTGAVNTSGAATTDINGMAMSCYTGPTSPGADAIDAFADTDSDGSQDLGEPAGAAEKTWVAGPPATLVLTPASATNPVGTQHCVTATVEDAFGNPAPGVTVRFAVTGAVNTSGAAMTDSNGMAMFCYTGPTSSGADAIDAFADTDNDGTQDPGEPAGAAEKTWVVPMPTSQDQCKNGGWRAFGVFKNQGDCVSFVSTKGKNPPSLP